MQKAGVGEGLSEKEAELLAKQTLLGTARLLSEKEISADELVAMVASKGGTTEAGLDSFEKSNLPLAVRSAFRAAVKRSRELGE
jgi:pyrroline-5-carboxylate reductase